MDGVKRYDISTGRESLEGSDINLQVVRYTDYAALEARVRVLTEALMLCEPLLDAQLTTLCESYCPPCEIGNAYDYSQLKEPELGWITKTEAALDAVNAALAGTTVAQDGGNNASIAVSTSGE